MPERHGHTPHQVDGMLIPIPAEGLPVQGERPTEGKCRSMNPGMRARRDVMYASMPWSTACCRVGCSPMSMIVHPEKAREAIGCAIRGTQYENNKSFLFEFISIQSSAAPGADKPGIMEGTAEVQHPIADAHLPEAAAVFDAAPALDTVMDMVAPQPTLVELLVRHVQLPREFLPQIGINSYNYCVDFKPPSCPTGDLSLPVFQNESRSV